MGGALYEAYVPAFAQRLLRARPLGIRIVAAYKISGRRAFPGSLLYAALGFPGDIPGVPRQYDLQGASARAVACPAK
jgi:hypothetical protein